MVRRRGEGRCSHMRGLIRCALALLLLLASWGIVGTSPAQAAGEGCYYKTIRTPEGPRLELYCPPRQGEDPPPRKDGGQDKCYYGGQEIPCVSERGIFYAPYGCWLTHAPVDPTDNPLALDLLAQHGGEGVVYLCYTGSGSPLYVWMADSNPPPNPAVLAARAVAQMQLRAPQIGIVPEASPGSVGVVGLPVWMWAADPGPSVTGPNTKSVSERGYTVTATAKLDRLEWSMGDGKSVTCRTAGTPYTDAAGLTDSPDCGYRYEQQGHRTVQVTAYWSVRWSGIGQTGTMAFDFSRTAEISIGEVQVINR